MVRGIEVGLLIGLLAPLIGIFLVLRRYSLIADTLAHVSLAGVAIGLLVGLNPLLTALGVSVASSVAIERLRQSRKIYGESALSIFLSGSLALAVILLGLSRGLNVDLFGYLFGSILTVRQSDIYLILILSVIVISLLLAFLKELTFISFDEEAAFVSGIPVRFLNIFFIVLAAAAIAVSIPIVGILLISALLVLPVITAIQLKKSFVQTIIFAEAISIISVLSGIVASFYLNISSGGAIVLIMIAIFFAVLFLKRKRY